jgi:hypothetical protein
MNLDITKLGRSGILGLQIATMSEQSNAEFLWTQFGFAGLLLFALTALAAKLFQLWIVAKESEHQHTLDIQRDIHIESLKQLTKRDEIRFSKLHENRAEIIRQLYGHLVLVLQHGKVYVNKKSITNSDRDQLYESIHALAAHVEINKIYFSQGLTNKLTELSDKTKGMGLSADIFCGAAVDNADKDRSNMVNANEGAKSRWRRSFAFYWALRKANTN